MMRIWNTKTKQFIHTKQFIPQLKSKIVDRNNVAIYEGDIVKLYNIHLKVPKLAVVVTHKVRNRYTFELYLLKGNKKHIGELYWYDATEGEIEVIGNILENEKEEY